jgi:hypothetical protein
MTKLYKGDVGISITVSTGYILSGATSVALRVKKPSGTIATWAPTVNLTDQTKLDYTTVAGDFNENGLYHVQAYAIVDGKILFGETAEFEIYGAYQ